MCVHLQPARLRKLSQGGVAKSYVEYPATIVRQPWILNETTNMVEKCSDSTTVSEAARHFPHQDQDVAM